MRRPESRDRVGEAAPYRPQGRPGRAANRPPRIAEDAPATRRIDRERNERPRFRVGDHRRRRNERKDRHVEAAARELPDLADDERLVGLRELPGHEHERPVHPGGSRHRPGGAAHVASARGAAVARRCPGAVMGPSRGSKPHAPCDVATRPPGRGPDARTLQRCTTRPAVRGAGARSCRRSPEAPRMPSSGAEAPGCWCPC